MTPISNAGMKEFGLKWQRSMTPISNAGMKEFGLKNGAHCPTLKLFAMSDRLTDGQTEEHDHLHRCIRSAYREKPSASVVKFKTPLSL